MPKIADLPAFEGELTGAETIIVEDVEGTKQASVGVLATRAQLLSVTPTSGNQLSASSSVYGFLDGAIPIIRAGRRLGWTIPAGATAIGSYVVPFIPLHYSVVRLLKGATVRIRTIVRATPGYLDAISFGGNAVQVRRRDGTLDANEGVQIGTPYQQGEQIVRDFAYVMQGDEVAFAATMQVGGGHEPVTQELSFEIVSINWDVISAMPLDGAPVGVDLALDARLLALAPSIDLFPRIEGVEDALYIKNGAVLLRDDRARGIGLSVPIGASGQDAVVQWRHVLNGRKRALLAGAQVMVVLGFDTSDWWNRAAVLNMQARTLGLAPVEIVTSNVFDAQISQNRRVMAFTFAMPEGVDLDDLRPFLRLNSADAATAAESIMLTDMSVQIFRSASDITRAAELTGALADESARAEAVEGALGALWGTGKGIAARIVAPSAAYASVQAALSAATVRAAPGAAVVVDLPAGTIFEHSLTAGDHVVLRGKGMGRTIIDGSLPANTPKADIRRISTIDFNAGQSIYGLTAIGKNCRYVSHYDAVNFSPDSLAVIEDYETIHLGNDEADLFHGEAVWPSQNGFAIGLCSGSRLRLVGGGDNAPRAALSVHDRTGFTHPATLEVVGRALTARQVGGAAFRVESVGSSVMNRAILTNNTASGDLIHEPGPWLPTDLADQPSERRCFQISGSGNSPMVWRNLDPSRALRIDSVTTGSASSIALSGSLVAVLFGEAVYEAGDIGLTGCAWGKADVSETFGVGEARDLFITALGKRLAAWLATHSSATLTVTADTSLPPQTFTALAATDYSAMTNAEIIALINAAIAGVAVASIFNVANRYRPFIADEEQRLQNTSGTTIMTGMALTWNDSGARTVRPMTHRDPASRFAGIAWQDIRPNAFGRVKTAGWIDRSDLLRSEGGVIDLGERFTLDADRPGYVRSGSMDGSGILECVRTIPGQDLVTLLIAPGIDVDAGRALDDLLENEADAYVVAQANADIVPLLWNEKGEPISYYDLVRGGFGMRHLDLEDDLQARAAAMHDIYSVDAVDPGIIPLEFNEKGQLLRWQDKATLEIFPRALLSSASTIAYVAIAVGQSNAEGEAGAAASLVRTDYKPAGRIRMLNSAARNVWLGKITSAGASTALLASEITGLADLRGAMGDGSHGTTSGEGYVLALSKALQERHMGFAPELVLLNNAEGGQTIANLQQGAPEGYHAFANFVVQLTRLHELLAAEGKRTWFDRANMRQGESDPNTADLGAQHEVLRAQMESAAFAITGEIVPLHMLDFQMSSFKAGQFAGVLDMLREHQTQLGPNARLHLVNPTYNFFRNSSDFLHLTSVEHERMGQMEAAMDMELRSTGALDNLHIASWSRTGANQITAIMSEAAEFDDDGEVDPIVNAGITLVGGDVSDVDVAGGNLIITTTGAASAVTAVRMALTGHGADRAQATVPRSNIRSAKSYGRYLDGRPIYKWAVHQHKEA